jgi:two-component system sensor histidine kinase/response regulator
MSDPQDAAGAAVLVVDDDQRNVRLIESILKGSGYRVLKAYNGEEALQVVETEHPDLLVLDVMMPRVSGFELCQQLKGRYETRLLPVIMVTALNALEDKVQALEYGADDFLTKPINKLELLAKVRSVLRVKALQDELERRKSEIEAANQELVRMQGFKESMMQMVVHDLKNPLASIMGNIQLIQMQSLETLTPVRLAELLQRTQESARQLMRMILNILQIGKLEEQKMPLRLEPVVLHALVQENADEMMGLSARDGIRLENRVGTDLPAPYADRELVSRIIANLLSNAFKHTPSGGLVVVDARTEGDRITLTISDTGEGIPEELQPRIFEKWVGDSDSSKRLLNDSGLGLTFCRLAVECHGGRIWLKSKAREGTTVFVSLPIAGPQTGSAPAASGASAA